MQLSIKHVMSVWSVEIAPPVPDCFRASLMVIAYMFSALILKFSLYVKNYTYYQQQIGLYANLPE